MAPQAGRNNSEDGETGQLAEHQVSSPPPLDDLTPFSRPETREPSLPPAVSWDAQTQSFAKRKRSTASQIFSDSSDPAIFSSDDDPALDNYAEGRHKKKRYVGSWFQQRPASSESGLIVRPGSSGRAGSRWKRPFVPVDSGVFMGSDSSIDDILDELPPAKANNAILPPATTTRPTAPQLVQVPRLLQKGKLSDTEAKAQEIIRRCVDRGIEAVDLSAQGLQHISNPTISLMSQIARIPNVERGVPFEHQDPELHLFLWSNQLTQVPGAVFDLDQLTILSLRGNSLTELPPAILKLKKLQTLNVSLNNLRHLPIELLELIYDPESSLETLMLHPNPWYQPEGGQELEAPWSSENADRTYPGPGPKGRGSKWLSREPRASSSYLDAKLWARSPVEFKDTKGKVYSAFRVRPDAKTLPTEDFGSEPLPPTQNTAQQRILLSSGVKTTKVPTLMEVALQASARNPYLSELPQILADTTQNTRMCDLLVDTQVYSYTGGLRCTVCKRPVIKPTAQWFEWWEIFVNRLVPGESADSEPRATVQYLTQSPEERLVPFVRRVCSWNCVRDPVRGLGRPSQDDKADANGGEGVVQE